MPYNLGSHRGILEPCDLDDLAGWFQRELKQVHTDAERDVLNTVVEDLNAFVSWPEKAMLLWEGCDRVALPGKRVKYHSYPDSIKESARAAGVRLDTRPNGPAIAAFLLSGGERPARFGSSNSWSIHHLYSGKFPYPGFDSATHAAKSGFHFTQSAGLIAAHPVADALADEFPFFTWFLRARAYLLFGYDPDSAFSQSQDAYGFCSGYSCEVLRAAA